MIEEKKWYERSAVRAWASMALLTLVALWAEDVPFVEGLKQNAEALAAGLISALGWSGATRSSKTPSP